MKEPQKERLFSFFKGKSIRLDGFRISKNYFLDINNNSLIFKNKPLAYNLDGKILAYEDRQYSWFFDIADELREKYPEDSGFIVLMICIAYLESNQQFVEGVSSNYQSTEFISRALERIFPAELTEQQRGKFVDGVRCGMFHDGMLRRDIFIDITQHSLFTMNQNVFTINPYIFLDRLKHDFVKYIKILKDPTKMCERSNFETIWNSQKGIH